MYWRGVSDDWLEILGYRANAFGLKSGSISRRMLLSFVNPLVNGYQFRILKTDKALK